MSELLDDPTTTVTALKPIEGGKGKKEGGPMMRHITDPEIRERVFRAQGWLEEQYTALGTWKAVARLIAGKSESAMVSFATGSYNGNPVHILGAIEKAMADDEEDVFSPLIVETLMARRVRRAIKQTRLRKSLGLLAGQSGTGKTTITRHIAKADSDRTVYYPANQTDLRRLWGPLSAIMSVAGLGSGKGSSLSYAYATLLRYFSTSHKGLIVDNAEFCSRELLQTLRTLAEEAETWIVFAGNERLHEFGILDGENPAAFTQFVSRCSVQDFLQVTQIRDEDVDLFARQLLTDPVREATMPDLARQARMGGGFRRLRDILQESLERSGGHRERITDKLVYASIESIARKRGVL